MMPQIQKDKFFKGLGYICLPTLLVLLFYWEVLGAYFDLLDVEHVPYEPSAPGVWISGGETWRSLQYALHRLIYIGFGLDPLPYRLLSLIVYICILPLLYHLYNLLLENKTLSKMAVILFASYYLNNESVARIVMLRDLLLPLFGVSTLVCFIHYRKAQSLKYYALALFSAFLATSSKETAIVIIPTHLLAVDYYISHGIFPPRVPSLTEVRRSLLPHLPFWLIALAPLILICMRPGNPFSHLYMAQDKTLIPVSTYLLNIYWFTVYSFSPCFVTTKLTNIFAFSIMAGLGWLFYRSMRKRRSLIITLIALNVISFLPYATIGLIPHYMTLPAVFSMFLVTLLAFEIGLFLYRLLEERLKGYSLSPDRTAAYLALLILLPAIFLNYKFIRQYMKNVVYAGKLLRETVEGTIKVLPQNPGESPIIYINLPCAVLSELPPALTCMLSAQAPPCQLILDFYYYNTTPSDLKVKAFLLDLGYTHAKLPSGAWYTLPWEWYWETPKLSAEEFNALSKDKKNKLFFFNPVSYKLEDVSGWSYQELKESLAPYRDKLDYIPPIKWP